MQQPHRAPALLLPPAACFQAAHERRGEDVRRGVTWRRHASKTHSRALQKQNLPPPTTKREIYLCLHCAALDDGVHAPPRSRRICAGDGDGVLPHSIKHVTLRSRNTRAGYLVRLDRERVTVRVRAQPVCLAQLGRAHELFVHVNLFQSVHMIGIKQRRADGAAPSCGRCRCCQY
jgi:hypothetical protein